MTPIARMRYLSCGKPRYGVPLIIIVFRYVLQLSCIKAPKNEYICTRCFKRYIIIMNKLLFFAILAVVSLCSANALAPDTHFPIEEETSFALRSDSAVFGGDSIFTLSLDSIQPGHYSLPLHRGALAHLTDGSMQVCSRYDKYVRSVFSGTVSMVDRHNEQKLTIVISHDNGLQTVYHALRQPQVHAGERVRAGQVIALADHKDKKHFVTRVEFYVGNELMKSVHVFNAATGRLQPEKLYCKLHRGRFISTTANYNGYAKALDRVRQLMVTSLSPFESLRNVSSMNLFDLSPMHWSYPLVNSYVTSPYNVLRQKDDSTTYHHTGVDIKTHINRDSIHAAFDGVVESANVRSGYGNCVVIRHAMGLETLYGHMTCFFIRRGDRVKAGQVIGLTGATGHATGDHLHFEVLYHGQRQDPALFFNHKSHWLQPAKILLGGPQLRSVAIKHGSLFPLYVDYKNHRWRNG